ncbi:hypothetical protein VNI00_001259 [Paramarasmius palmivorus]|uniref:Small ribosomal subunit protein bS18m n=1 Tax=Paramarasmius palmivorus TaxID=297713 RepID=A0AAW0E952_9AGAR
MFSLRQAAKSCLRPFSARCNSTAAKADPTEGLGVIKNVIKEEAKKNPTSFVRNADSPYRSFAPNTFITPQRLTYKAVKKEQRIGLSRPKVGPSKREARKTDPFYQLNIDPLDMTMNPAILNNYMSEMGKIYPRSWTNLTWKSQRRLGKAIRRARMMGIIPLHSKRNILDTSTFQTK